MSYTNTNDLLAMVSERQVQAQDKINTLLKKEGFQIKPRRGLNNYRNYIWTEITSSNKLFWITMFWNDIDSWNDLSKTCGNFHTQIGRIQFWKEIMITKVGETNRLSPCNIIESEKSKVTLLIDKNKSGDPIAIIKEEGLGFTPEECLNSKFITIDDIIENPAAVKAVVEAFKRFTDS